MSLETAIYWQKAEPAKSTREFQVSAVRKGNCCKVMKNTDGTSLHTQQKTIINALAICSP